ncbi:hypothetical protein [Nitrospirillum sp. BR 11163]|uniref:hypothetical protein n=1 Tax=Nitrospirillum sp. BR 11163 TaxID=3104323 RepID=UPI002AFEC2F8|nr:hypothetical protein [Nitrospirillum sp. BR 11163]MEA1671924.1 hypothetical protein [Nitrospirillum sp. BR 11163]
MPRQQGTIMTSPNFRQHDASSHHRGPATHIFAVGQFVHLKLRFGQPLRFADIYRITGTLPARDESPQYRIRSDSEPHERMVAQNGLLPAGSAPTKDSPWPPNGVALSKEKRRGNREIRKPKQRETPLSAPERAAGKPNTAPKVPDASPRKGIYRQA